MNFSDPTAIADALEHADLRVLLMVLFHLTGDEQWLQAPYLPARDVDLIADEGAGFTTAMQARIREQAASILTGAPQSVVGDPGNELMVRMMSTCLGEKVPAEYAPMMREQLGFVERNADIHAPSIGRFACDKPVVIVGAGASGLSLGASLLELGIPFFIAERNAEVGGTWFENIYPGCSVDTPNHAYSFSFGPSYRWRSFFSPRSDIQGYLEKSATCLGLRPYIRFKTRVQSARFDESAGHWEVVLQGLEGNYTVRALALVSAIGQLSLPSIPQIEGIGDFDGPIFHSARWPRNLDVSGKRVAIIGTGATSMQVVPTIADQVQSITIYQRSAQWARPIPRFHEVMSEQAQWLLDAVPFYSAWFRLTMFWRYGDGLLPTLRKDPDWPDKERSLNRHNDRHREQMTDHILSTLAGREDLIQKCLPTYPPYGKRILLDNGWFETLLKPNVELVTDPVECIESGGVRTRDGDVREADIVVLATGFQVGKMAARLNITGRDGVNLSDVWCDNDPTAYLGITVPGFPNLFCTQGPNTGLGHGGSAIFTGECQAHYIAACLSEIIRRDGATMEPRREAHDEYMARVDAEHEQMIWTHPGMSTYYRNAKGRVYSVMPWRLVDYWLMTRLPDIEAYQWSAPVETVS